MANKTSWAIRSLSRKDANSEYFTYMEIYYRTRKEMREAWKKLPEIFKGGLSPSIFASERYRVEDYDLIGKRSYTKVR